MIDEARDRPVGADGPAIEYVQNNQGIEIQRIGVLPVDSVVVTDLFPIRPDSEKGQAVEERDRGAKATGLQWDGR